MYIACVCALQKSESTPLGDSQGGSGNHEPTEHPQQLELLAPTVAMRGREIERGAGEGSQGTRMKQVYIPTPDRKTEREKKKRVGIQTGKHGNNNVKTVQ